MKANAKSKKTTRPAVPSMVAVSHMADLAIGSSGMPAKAPEESAPQSPMKFFFLWFGLPMLTIGLMGWAMGHC
jgi:hypothetical protein